MVRVFILATFLAVTIYMVAGFPSPQDTATTVGPSIPGIDPQQLQDCQKQQAECEKRFTEGNSGAGQVISSPVGPAVKPVQDGVVSFKPCNRQYELCLQGKGQGQGGSGQAPPPPEPGTPQ